MWRECDIPNSYTLEASFAGANFGAKSGLHMNILDFEAMGAALCDTMLDYWDPDQSKVEAVHKEMLLLYPDRYEAERSAASKVKASMNRMGSSYYLSLIFPDSDKEERDGSD